jgi:UDP-GlcNAc:undecaprenyl-phosphate GlcNAc-1-phosphate transferase
MINSVTFSLFETILIAMILSLVSARLGIWIAKRIKLLDVPASAPHKQHSKPTPIAGGFALFMVLIAYAVYQKIWLKPELQALLFGSLIILIFGLWDDIKAVPPLVKLSGQLLAVILLITSGVYIRLFESPDFFIHGEGGIYVWLDWILTAVWVIGITNAFNFVDSADGLATLLAGTAAAFLMLVTLDSNQPNLSLLNALLLGTCTGLFFYNAPPARLFLGDAGAQTLGFILASIAIVYTPIAKFQTSSWFVPIMILGVPIFDMTLVVLSRIRRGNPIYKPNLDHTYHRLVSLGVDSNHAVLAMLITALSLGCLAFIALNLPPPTANGIFAATLVLGVSTFVYLDNKKRR